MKRHLNLLLLLAAMMLLVMPASAQKQKQKQAIPEEAIGEKTMLAVYVDVTQFDAQMLDGLGDALLGLTENEALQDQDFALPLGDPKQIVDMLTLLRGSFLEAGGEGLMLTLEMPTDESWSPPMALLAKTNDTFDAASMSALIRGMTGEQMVDAQVQPIAAGWQNIVMKSKEGDAVTLPLPDKDPAVFAAFNAQLTQHQKPMLAVAFRMQDQIREMMDVAEQAAKQAQPGQGQDAQAQMAMGMMMGMFKPVRSLDTLGLAISQVDGEMLIDAQMTFQDAQSAQQFANLYNSVMMFAPVMLAGAAQDGQIENMPDPATINSFFMKLRMQVAGESLTLKLDKEFFDLVEKLAPLFEGLAGDAEPDIDL